MNTFAITLEPFSDREAPTGCALRFESIGPGLVLVKARIHRPGPKGGTYAETELGRLHECDLARVLSALHALAGGCQ